MNALDDWLKENKHDLFGRKRIMIPTPHFVIFYNGTEKRPEYEEMRLSKSFYHQMEEPEIELICKAYNINPQNNQELKRRSLVLDGYTYFVEKVRDNLKKKMSLTEAIDAAIEDCIRNHVLEDFFRNRKDEVRKMTHLDYTWEKREKLIRKEEYEDGKAAGLSEGISKGRAAGISKGRADSILELLEDLGKVSDELLTKIMSEKDLQTLSKWHKLAARVESIDMFQERM